LVESRHFENCSYVLVHPCERELAAVFFDALHCLDQDGQARTIDVRDAGKVDYETRRMARDHCGKRRRDTWRDVKVNFTFEGENIWRIGYTHFDLILSRSCSVAAAMFCRRWRFGSSGCQRRIDIRKNPKDLIEPGDLENRAHWFLQTGERELAAIFLDVLHTFDQDR